MGADQTHDAAICDLCQMSRALDLDIVEPHTASIDYWREGVRLVETVLVALLVLVALWVGQGWIAAWLGGQ